MESVVSYSINPLNIYPITKDKLFAPQDVYFDVKGE